MGNEPEVKVLNANEGIKAFDPVAAGLAELKAKYSGLKVNGIEDKEGYEAIKKAKADLVSKRTSVEPIKKALTEKAREYVSLINAEAKRIIDEITAIEIPIEAEKQRIDDLIAKQKEEKANAELKEYNRRINACIEEGMVFNSDGNYQIGPLCVTPAQIKASAPEKFEKFIERVRLEHKAIQESIKQQEAIQAQELANIESQKKEQEDRQRELDEREKKIKEAEEQLNAQKRAVNSMPAANVQEAVQNSGVDPNEPVRSPEEAVEESKFSNRVPDKARLAQFATYLSFNMPPMVPQVEEEWAVPIADKMREQFEKMATYIRERLPKD